MHRYDAVPNQNFPPHLFPFPGACTLILPSFRLDGWTEFFSGREGNALSSCACWILVRPSRRVCHVTCGSGRSARRERDDARQSEGCIILDGHRTGKVTWAYAMCVWLGVRVTEKFGSGISGFLKFGFSKILSEICFEKSIPDISGTRKFGFGFARNTR
jgi:hypothetical protein